MAAGRRLGVLITDGHAGFKAGYRKAIHARTMPQDVPMADACMRNRHPANTAYELLNREIRGKIACICGFRFRDSALLGLLITCHNFMRSHWIWTAEHQ